MEIRKSRGEIVDEEQNVVKKTNVSSYNKSGLIAANQTISSNNLPFIETLQLCLQGVDQHDENEDLEREVLLYQRVSSYHSPYRICRWHFTIRPWQWSWRVDVDLLFSEW